MAESISEKEIKSKLGLDIQPNDREKILREFIELRKNDTLFSVGGKCHSTSLKIYSNNYFLAQSFDGKKEDIRRALQNTFNKFALSVITVDKEIGGLLFCNIASLIMGTPFGVYYINKEQKPNVYLELGVSIGLRKPFVLVKDQNISIAKILSAVHYYEMNSYLSLSEEFGDLTNEYLTRLGSIDETLIPPTSSITQEVCISLGDLEVTDIGLTLALLVSRLGYQPIFIGQPDKELMKFLEKNGIKSVFYETLQETAKIISRCKFGIYRIDATASSSSFVNLGIAIGMNRPTFMINNLRESVPSDLSNFHSLKFEGMVDLDEKFKLEFPAWKESFLVAK